METASRERRFEFDHLRVLATFGVILLHSGAIGVVAWLGTDTELLSRFNAGNFFDAAGRFAVNCFFMVSGALLLDPHKNFALRKQFLKVLLPTLTWILVFAGAIWWLDSRDVPAVGGALSRLPTGTPEEIARALLAGPAVYHLWFVYVLLGIYLCVPLLRALTDRPAPEAGRLVRWFVIVWLLFDQVPRIGAYLFGEDFPTLYPNALESGPTGYLGLFVLGFGLAHGQVLRRAPYGVWPIVATAGFAWTFIGVWRAAAAGQEIPEVFTSYGNLNPPVLVFSIGVFACFATRSWGPGPLWPLVRRLSELSFRVYLLHALVLHLLRFTTDLGDLVAERPEVGVPAIWLATVVISFGLAWLLDFAKPLRRWI